MADILESKHTPVPIEWHTLVDPSSSSSSSSPDRVVPSSSRVFSHVRLDRGELKQPIPALTGRTHQRFDGERRLVCGCVAFRIDRIEPECEASHSTAAAAAATSSATPAAAAAAASSPSSTLSVLLVHGRKKGDWIFPKGGHELFETSSECARRECLEEGGVEGELITQLETIDYTSKKGKHTRLTPFLMKVHTYHLHFAEEGERDRCWFRYEDVDSLMKREETRQVWKDAKQQLIKHGYVDQHGRPIWNENKQQTTTATIDTADATTIGT